MQKLTQSYLRVAEAAAGPIFESAALLLTRVALAGVFWRSGRTKVEEGSLLNISDTTYFLFEHEYSGVPIPHEIAAPMATFSEHFFPILLVLGLVTRFSAFSLLGMAAVLISRGAGIFSLDHLLGKRLAQ